MQSSPEMEKQNLSEVENRHEICEKYVEEEGAPRRVSVIDDVFGELSEEGPNYRSVSYSW